MKYDREARQCVKDRLLNYESIAAAEAAAARAQEVEPILVGGPPPRRPLGLRGRPASGFYGVTANCKRWKAVISYDGKKHNLGTFDTKEEAALVYDREARQCGKDKLLNYESGIAAAEAAAARAEVEHAPKLVKPGLGEAPKKRKELLPPGDAGAGGGEGRGLILDNAILISQIDTSSLFFKVGASDIDILPAHGFSAS
jgi:hypothetical protein